MAPASDLLVWYDADMADNVVPITFKFYYADQLTPEEEAERKAKHEAVDRPKRAIVRLWRAAIDEMRIRYPDPRVNVVPKIQRGTDQFTIRLEMDMLRDTANPDHFMPNFGHNLELKYQWPGYEVAQAYVTAGWVLYMIHEGMELVTRRNQFWPNAKPGNRKCSCGCGQVIMLKENAEPMIINAHDVYGVHQKALSTGTYDIASTIDWALGLGAGQRMIEMNAEKAAKELAAEIDPWLPGV